MDCIHFSRSKSSADPKLVAQLKQAIIEDNKDGLMTLFSDVSRKTLDLDVIIEDGMTPLKFCVMMNKTEMAAFFIKEGADVTKGHLWEGVSQAIDANNMELLKLLLDANVGAEFADPYADGHTPMTKAVLKGNLPALEMLIERGCNVNKRGFVRRTPLHMACILGWKDGIELLLKHNADPLLEMETSKNVLSCAMDHDSGMDIVKLLLRACLNRKTAPKQQSLFLNGVLVDAIVKSKHEIVEFMLKHGADPNASLMRNMITSLVPPLPAFCCDDKVLHLAIRYKNIRTIEHLIIAGADVNTSTVNKVSPMHLAAMLPPDEKCSGSVILNLLIYSGAALQPVGFELGVSIPTVGQLNDVFLREHIKRPTPLALALALQKYTTFLQLLDANCDPEFCLLTCIENDEIAVNEVDIKRGEYLTLLYNPGALLTPPCLVPALISCGMPQNVIIGYLRKIISNSEHSYLEASKQLSVSFCCALSLRMLTRAAIRTHIRRHSTTLKFSHMVLTLNLPKFLKEYILFSDIWDDFYNKPTWE